MVRGGGGGGGGRVVDRGKGMQELEVRLTRGVEELQRETTFKEELTQRRESEFSRKWVENLK
jgi:hypothetical protein